MTKMYSTLKNLQIELLKKNFHKLELKCLVCDEHFSDTTSNLYKKETNKTTPCPYCNKSKTRTKDIEALVLAKKGILIEFFSDKSRCMVQCEMHHAPWEISYSNLKRGKWCPTCAGKKITTDQLRELASRKGFKLISPKYITSNTKYNFRCQVGHTFELSHNKLQSSAGCPDCTKGVSERIVREYFEKCFDDYFPNLRNLEWLKNQDGNNLELDGYNRRLGIAFEHQGLQHYGKKNAFNSNDDSLFEKIKEHDKIKQELCEKENVKLILIPQLFTMTKLEILPDLLVFEFLRLEITPLVSPYEVYIEWDKVYNSQHLAELIIECKVKNIEVIDTKFKGAKTKLNFKCLKCNHKFITSPQSLKGCPKCAGNLPKTIADVEKLAKSKDLTLVSTVYVNSKKDLEFNCNKCSKIIFSSYDKVSVTENGCSECYYKNKTAHNRLSEKEIKKKLKLLGLAFISSKVKNNTTYIEVKCKKCKALETKRLASVTSGKGCNQCGNSLISQKLKKPIEIVLAEAEAQNLTLLSTREHFKKGRNKLPYKCNCCGKKLLILAGNVSRGQGCKSCKLKKLT